jgi:hypothetical protein
MEPKFSPSLHTTNLTLPFCKPTLLLTAFATGIIATYYFDMSSMFTLEFKRLEEYEFWRFVTSPLASLNQVHFISNLVAVAILTMVSERQKGSVLHLFDFLIKMFLINLFSLLLYIIVFSCSVLYQGPFSFIVKLQDEIPGAGLQFVLICELFLLLSESGTDEDGGYRNRYSTPVTLLFSTYFIIMCCLHFKYVGFLAAVLLSLLVRLGLFSYMTVIASSRFVKSTEIAIHPLGFMFYFSRSAQPEISFYEMNEQHSFQSKNKSQTTQNTSQKEAEHSSEEGRSNSDELSKSRYEEVNVHDYVLEKGEEDPVLREQESFEI